MAQALEYDLVEKSSEDFYCPITMEILTEPHQTLCCGNHLSPEAADRLKREGKPCPMCKEPNLTTVFDKYFKRMVYQLKVRCPKKALGCDWVGELGDLEKHLSEGSVDGECPFVAVACPFSCGDNIQRHQLGDHIISDCLKYPFQCPNYCGENAIERQYFQKHLDNTCPLQVIECPNKCGVNAIERRHVQKHLDTTCPLQVIECKYSYAGCDAKLQRQNMEAHLNESRRKHQFKKFFKRFT